MLLLSSATRIFGTTRPPAIPHLRKPLRLHRSQKACPAWLHWSIRGRARQSYWGSTVSQNNTAHSHSSTRPGPSEIAKCAASLPPTCLTSKLVPAGRKGLPRNDFLQSLFPLAARFFLAILLVRRTCRLVPGLW